MSLQISLEYSLRVAALQILLERRLTILNSSPSLPSSDNSHTTSAPSISNGNGNGYASSSALTPNRRSADGGGGFFAFDLSSLMGREGSKSKYPKEMLKILDEKLKRISMGQETKYSDARFRRAIALFWGKQWGQDTFQRQLKDSRKIEDIILPFVTTATKSLRDDPQLPDGQWKSELNTQISLFMSLLSDSLHITGGAPGELMARLDSYKERLRDTPPAPVAPLKEIGDRDSVKSFTPARVQPSPASGSLKGKATDTVWKLFGMHEDALEAKLRELQGSCTEAAALDDLKNVLKLLNTEQPFPYGPTDFAESSTWAAYRASEVSTLSSMMLTMMQNNPALVQASERDRHSNADLSTQMASLKVDGGADSPFTFIPPDPRANYREILSLCLDWDLEMLKSLPEDEDVSLGVLSPDHSDLLSECALRWRLPPSFRAWVFLEAIVDRYELGHVPAACVHEATGMIAKVSEESSIDQWAISDRDGLIAAFIRRDICLLTAVETALIHIPAGYLSPDFHEAVSDYIGLSTTDVSKQAPMDRAAKSIMERVRIQAYKQYISEASEMYERQGGKTRGFAMAMGQWIEKETKKLMKKFQEPLAENLDIVALVLVQQLTLWFRDVEDAMRTPSAEAAELGMEEAFVLYRLTAKMLDMGNAFSNEPLGCSVAPMFASIVEMWLDETALKTRQWADTALAVDNFEATSANGPSSSVTDLFDSFHSASEFLMHLDWPDEQQLANFATRLAKIFSISVNDYCLKMEQLFAADMRQNDVQQPAQAEAKQKAWIEKAKSTIASLQGEKKLVAFFNFTPSSCVKLNNVEAARQRLDKLYQEMRVDDFAAYETETTPYLEGGGMNFLFSVKVVLAEGLALDSPKLPDCFVILSDEHGNRHAKTRTVYDDADPRWDETFDIPVKGSAWFMATVRHRNLSGKHDLLGRSYLRLDPSQHADLISKDVLLPLDTRGHLLLRISMEGERDDIQFHFGRAFRWLKRTESDMVRTFVDKMTPVLRQTLSRASIKAVLKPAGAANPLDYNQALDKISAAYRSAMGANDYTIPLPSSEKVIRKPLSDAEIETAIHPLFDYLDANNHTLASTLSADAMQSVMAKLWKQILMTIEALIVPPLSDKPSHLRALSDGELDIALKWLKFLRDFFYAGGAEGGVPLATLQTTKYNEIMSLRIYYDWTTDALMEGFQTTLKHRATRPSKSLLSQRNLGTIRARKSAKKAMQGGNNTEMIMRILRMRPGTQEFLAQQIQIMSVVKMENPKKSRSLTSRFTR